MPAIIATRFIGINRRRNMQMRYLISALVLALVLPGTPGYAHHSVSAEFDLSKRITLEGRVSKIEWMNPHVYLYVDVDADGKTANWACETAGPTSLARQGWSRLSLKIGNRITVVGYPARDG